MKRMVMAGLLAVALAAVADSAAWAFGEPGVGASGRHVGRINGHWVQHTTGPLYDYSLYFAAMYPQLPGAQELLYGNPDYYRYYPIPSPFAGDPSAAPAGPYPGPNPTFGRGRHGNMGTYGNTLPPGATIMQPPATGSTPPPAATPSR